MARVLDRKKGSVRWFDCRRGFGFIIPSDGGDDVFVHCSSVKAIGFVSLAKGENVEFSIVAREDGRHSAVDVTGPGGAYLHGGKGPFFSFGEFGHLARDCIISNGGCRDVGPCYDCGGMELPSPTPCPWKPCSLDSQISQTICGMSLPNFSLEEDFRNDATVSTWQCWKSSGIVEDEEDDNEDNEEDDDEHNEEDDDEDNEEDYDEDAKNEENTIFGEPRNWSELPQNVLSLIFKKIAALEILTSVQFVCRTWRQLSHEPEIWRCIDVISDPFCTFDVNSVAMMAVDRSKGCLEEFCLEYFGNDEILSYIADRTATLRCLRLISTHEVSGEGLAEAVRRLPMLKDLEFSLCYFDDGLVELVGRACPQLKSFSLNTQPYLFKDDLEDDDSDWNRDGSALAIAKHMHQLTRLQLIGDTLTNDGLHSILDNCPHLEHLDIRRCLYLNLDESLKRKCARIRVVRLPHDSVADFPFDVTIGGLEEPEQDPDSDMSYDNYSDDGFLF